MTYIISTFLLKYVEQAPVGREVVTAVVGQEVVVAAGVGEGRRSAGIF